MITSLLATAAGDGKGRGILQGRKILIVDDDPVLVGLLEDAFSREGAEVCTALDGKQGLRQFFDHRPDLVLLAGRMPVMDGWQTCARIRDFCDVPVIMLSALGTEEEIVRGLDSGAADYVIKPFSLKELMARVRALLRRAPLYPGVEPAAACAVLRGSGLVRGRLGTLSRGARPDGNRGDLLLPYQNELAWSSPLQQPGRGQQGADHHYNLDCSVGPQHPYAAAGRRWLEHLPDVPACRTEGITVSGGSGWIANPSRHGLASLPLHPQTKVFCR